MESQSTFLMKSPTNYILATHKVVTVGRKVAAAAGGIAPFARSKLEKKSARQLEKGL